MATRRKQASREVPARPSGFLRHLACTRWLSEVRSLMAYVALLALALFAFTSPPESRLFWIVEVSLFLLLVGIIAFNRIAGSWTRLRRKHAHFEGLRAWIGHTTALAAEVTAGQVPARDQEAGDGRSFASSSKGAGTRAR